MRINQFIAQTSGISRRKADEVVASGRVTINNRTAKIGEIVNHTDAIHIDRVLLKNTTNFVYIMLNKPIDYVCSRAGQGSKTIYELLPAKYHNLKPVGRLDKDSSGLLLLTNDGELANKLTHPSYNKEKVYKVEINRPLKEAGFSKITKIGVDIGEKNVSKFQLKKLAIRNQEIVAPREIPNTNYCFLVTLTEGKNRQIRRTFSALGYKVTRIHRIKFGSYKLGKLANSKYIIV